MQNDTSVVKLDINLIIPNKYQPRKVFDENSLLSLSESIKNYGIINPILVRKKDNKYEIIAGERRFRAAKKIGLTEVPVIIKSVDEQELAEFALLENIQRQELSAIEEAKSYEEIMRIGNETQTTLAKKLGKSQSTIANKMRLLSLPEEVQDALANKKISERHARSLINIESKEKQLDLLNRIIKDKLTVKETEQIIKENLIDEDEIKKAINDIMNSLNMPKNLKEKNKKEEKEDDNMNNGNFFPNFDNNNQINNNASLNMMNMQSMNQTPIAPEPEIVMPTMAPLQEHQSISTLPINDMQTSTVPSFEQFSQSPMNLQNVNNNFNPMDNFVTPYNNNVIQDNMMGSPLINDAPLFGPTPTVQEPQLVVSPQSIDMSQPINNPAPTQTIDTPLFNPNVTMPSQEETVSFVGIPEVSQPKEITLTQDVLPTNSANFEVPVNNQEPVNNNHIDRLLELQNILTSNGYSYKLFSNETDNCIIIELPKN